LGRRLSCNRCQQGGDVIPIEDPEHADHSDLRSPQWPWASDSPPEGRVPRHNFSCDILIVGAGITGALIAERLTRRDLDVVVVDRQQPGRGSTAASTAMLLWEIDRPLAELADLYSYEKAARCYQASFQAVTGLKQLVAQLGVECLMRPRNHFIWLRMILTAA
jgi:FAD dependent oxidoreductase